MSGSTQIMVPRHSDLRSVGLGEYAPVTGGIDGSVSAGHVELHEDGSNVVLDGAVGDKEPVGDFAVAQALGQ